MRFTAFPSGGTGSYDFQWEFGDGATSAARRPAHTYTSPGVHLATLTVTSGDQIRQCDPPDHGRRRGGAVCADTLSGRRAAAGPRHHDRGGERSFSYSPNPANARVGQRVLWRNADGMGHTATANGGAFDTGVLAPGASSAAVTMGAAGTFPYFCGLHPAMVGTVIVTP